MDKKVYKSEYKCIICDKFYASKTSLCNHNRKFHKPLVNQSKPLVNQSKPLENQSKLNCKYCNKILSCKQSKSRHQKICKSKNDNNLKKEIVDFIKKNIKIHPKTLEKINKQLELKPILNNINNNTTNNTNNNTINNTNNNTINNTINNTTNNNNNINLTFVKFEHENISELLTNKEMFKIINKARSSVKESVKLVHFNDERPEYVDKENIYFSLSTYKLNKKILKIILFNEYKNIFITNMKDDLAYVFNGDKFVATFKNYVLKTLFDNHISNIDSFINENNIDENKHKYLFKFINESNDEEYKTYLLNELKQFVYNNSDKKLLKKLNNLELKEK